MKKPCGAPRTDYVVVREDEHPSSTGAIKAMETVEQKSWIECNAPCRWIPGGAGQAQGACMYRNGFQWKVCGEDYNTYGFDAFSAELAKPSMRKPSMSLKSVLSIVKKSVKKVDDVKVLAEALDKVKPECVDPSRTIQDIAASGKLMSLDGADQEAIDCALRKYLVDNQVTVNEKGLFVGTSGALFTSPQVVYEDASAIIYSCSVAGLQPNFISVKSNRQHDPLPMLYELYMGKVVNSVRRKLPNFVYTYGGFYCSLPVNASGQADLSKMCTANQASQDVILMTELVTNGVSLRKMLVDRKLSLDELSQVMLQVIFAANQLYFEAGIQHNELHANNIMVRELAQPITIEYKVYYDVDLAVSAKVTSKYLAVLFDYTNAVHAFDNDYIHLLKLEARIKPLIHPLKDFMAWVKFDGDLMTAYAASPIVKMYLEAVKEYGQRYQSLSSVQKILQRFVNYR